MANLYRQAYSVLESCYNTNTKAPNLTSPPYHNACKQDSEQSFTSNPVQDADCVQASQLEATGISTSGPFSCSEVGPFPTWIILGALLWPHS